MSQHPSLEGISSLDPNSNLPISILHSEVTSLTDWGLNEISIEKSAQDIPSLLLDNTIDSTTKPGFPQEEQQNFLERIKAGKSSSPLPFSVSPPDDSDFLSVLSDESNNFRIPCSPLLDVFSWPEAQLGYVGTEPTQISDPRIDGQLLDTIKQALSKHQV
jgi:hypothetical protein